MTGARKTISRRLHRTRSGQRSPAMTHFLDFAAGDALVTRHVSR
jgi:hypothetical protein